MLRAPTPGAPPAITFIDFELAGCHYRGYDLFKLFRTGSAPSATNMRTFLGCYAAAAATASLALGPSCSHAPVPPADAAASGLLDVWLDEFRAEAYCCEPLTWLEAAVFFLFAITVYPSQSTDWAPLAVDRWERYLDSAAAIDADGEAAVALLAARAKRYAAVPA